MTPIERGVGQVQVDEAGRSDRDRGDRRRLKDPRRLRGSARRRSPRQSRAAAGAVAGPASSPGSWRGRHARDWPVARPRSMPPARRPRSAAAIPAGGRRGKGALDRLDRRASQGRIGIAGLITPGMVAEPGPGPSPRSCSDVEAIARVDQRRLDPAARPGRRGLRRCPVPAGEEMGQQDPAGPGLPRRSRPPRSRRGAGRRAGPGPSPNDTSDRSTVAWPDERPEVRRPPAVARVDEASGRAVAAQAASPDGCSAGELVVGERGRADPERIRVVGVGDPRASSTQPADARGPCRRHSASTSSDSP